MAAVQDLVARSQLRDHARRLDRHDKRFDAVDDHLTRLRIEMAKLIAYALVVVSLFSTAGTALIVHYLTPTHAARTPAAPTHTASR